MNDNKKDKIQKASEIYRASSAYCYALRRIIMIKFSEEFEMNVLLHSKNESA